MRFLGTLMAAAWIAYGTALPAQSQSARIAESVQRITSRSEFAHARFGIAVYDPVRKEMLYRLNADDLFTGASTTKLVTEGTALEILGGDYRFHTRVYALGERTNDGVLRGDLVLVAGGDPNLSNRTLADGTLAFMDEDHSYGGPAVKSDPLAALRTLAKQVAAAGIRRIDGKVLVDASLFPEGLREGGTGVVISPIMVNDNLIDLLMTPGTHEGDPTHLTVSPDIGYVRVVNNVRTGPAGSAPDLAPPDESVAPDGVTVLAAVGSVPAGAPALPFGYPVAEPSRYAEQAFAAALRDADVIAPRSSLGTAEREAALAPLRPRYSASAVVAELASPPLREDVKVTLKVSQNLHAWVTPYLLGALGGKPGRGADRAGFERMRAYLKDNGLDTTGASQGDGAGGNGRFTPAFMVHFLEHMAKQKDFPDFLHALPILGRDGSLVGIQADAPAAGHVFAKTGTDVEDDLLNGRIIVVAKGLAGYIETAGGRRLIFAAYLNNLPIANDPGLVKSVASQVMGEIANAIYEAVP